MGVAKRVYMTFVHRLGSLSVSALVVLACSAGGSSSSGGTPSSGSSTSSSGAPDEDSSVGISVDAGAPAYVCKSKTFGLPVEACDKCHVAKCCKEIDSICRADSDCAASLDCLEACPFYTFNACREKCFRNEDRYPQTKAKVDALRNRIAACGSQKCRAECNY
jgi:hypothetical protein